LRKKSGGKNIRENFAHQLTREQIEEFRLMPAKAKLQWLEDANNFIIAFLDRSKRIRWDERRANSKGRG
jgi:hypothetical protein